MRPVADLADLANAAQQHLPGYLLWIYPLALIALSFVVSHVSCRLSERFALRAYRRTEFEHWTEAARQLWPVRSSALGGLVLCTVLPAILALHLHGPLTPINPRLFGSLSGLAGFIGALLGLGSAEGIVYGARATSAAVWRSVGMSYLLILPGLLLIVLMMLLMPGTMGWLAGIVTVGGLLAMQWVLQGGLVKPLQWLGVVIPAPSELEDMAAELAAKLELPMPQCYELNVLSANAMVLPLCNKLFVTSVLMHEFKKEELHAVLAHEFGHLGESARVRRMRRVATTTIMLVPACLPLYGSFGVVAALLFLIIPVVVSRLALARIRNLESAADEVAMEHEGDSGTYARALEGLSKHNLTPVVMAGKGTSHPHIYDRLEAAGLTPDYPRPMPPPRAVGMRLGVLLSTLMVAYLAVIITIYTKRVRGLWDYENGELTAIGMSGGQQWPLFALAELRYEEGETAAALDLGRFAAAQRPDAYMLSRFAKMLAASDLHDEALEMLAACRLKDAKRKRPALQFERGLIYASLGHAQQANEELERGLACLAEEPFDHDPWIRVQLAFLFRALERAEDGEHALAKARELARIMDVGAGLEDWIAEFEEQP